MARNFVAANSDLLKATTAIQAAAPLTLAIWFKPVSAAVAYGMFHVNDGSASNRLGISTGATGTVAAVCSTGGVSSNGVTSTTYSAGTWNLATAVFTSSILRAAFLNGGGKGTNVTSSTPTGLNATNMGNNGAVAPFNGSLAFGMAWSSALSDADVARLFITGPTGLVGYLVSPSTFICLAELNGVNSPELDSVGGLSFTVTGTTVVAAPSMIFAHPPRVVAASQVAQYGMRAT